MAEKGTVEDILVESSESPTNLDNYTPFPSPRLGNQTIVEDKIEVDNEVPTPTRPYSLRILGSIFQKNEIQGIKEVLREDRPLGPEPSSRYFF